MRARRDNKCTGCGGKIEKDTDYYGNSYSAFCQSCGEKKQQKELVYSQADKSYIKIEDKVKCDYCTEPSIGHLNGKSVCQEHIGKAVEIEID